MSNIDLLTQEERTQIAIEEFKNGPVQSIAHVVKAIAERLMIK